MQYDEDDVLTNYVWHNYHGLLTLPERQWANAARLRAKGFDVGDGLIRRRLEQLAGDYSAQAAHLTWRSIRDRLLRDHADEITIHRCPECERILRTPKARQCLWCGNNWHSPSRS
jgi:hypothetical protein